MACTLVSHTVGRGQLLPLPWRRTFARDAKRFIFCERGAGRDGYASGGVPVTGALPELGQSRSAGLRPPKWDFTGTWAAHHDPRTISQLMQKRFIFYPDAEKIHFLNVAPAAAVTLPVECRSPARYRPSVKVEVPV
jgi:hypothetical protein